MTISSFYISFSNFKILLLHLAFQYQQYSINRIWIIIAPHFHGQGKWRHTFLHLIFVQLLYILVISWHSYTLSLQGYYFTFFIPFCSQFSNSLFTWMRRTWLTQRESETLFVPLTLIFTVSVKVDGQKAPRLQLFRMGSSCQWDALMFIQKLPINC